MKTDGSRRRVALLAALVTFLTALGAFATDPQPPLRNPGRLRSAPPHLPARLLRHLPVRHPRHSRQVQPRRRSRPRAMRPLQRLRSSMLRALGWSNPHPREPWRPSRRRVFPGARRCWCWRSPRSVVAAVYVRRSKLAVGNVTAGNRLRVMSSVRVGPKGYLVLAGVGERAILLGVTDDSVRRIAWMDSEVSPPPRLPVVAEPSDPLKASRADASTPPFRDFLRGLRASAGSATKELQVSGPADEVAAEKEDVVQWSAGVTASKPTRKGLPPVEPSPSSGSSASPSASSLEQQAAGIARRKARRPT